MNKYLVSYEKPVSFGGAGSDVALTLASLANMAGRASKKADIKSGADANYKPVVYRWFAKFKLVGSGTVGNTIDLYAAVGDGTLVAGNLPDSDAAMNTAGKLKNLVKIGSVYVESTTASDVMIAGGTVLLPGLTVNLVVWNGSGAALSATSSDCQVELTPMSEVR